MSVVLTPAYMDKTLFLDMAKDYIETLAQYDSSIKWDEQSWTGAMWRANFIMEERTVQGFVITDTVPFHVFPDALYIEEFYIVPEARRKGIGLEAAKAVTANTDKDVFLYILNGNREARLFWMGVESKLGWEKIIRPEIRQEKGCELRVYHTKG